MPPRQRNRERVCAPRRSPDGSAFQKCDWCGEKGAVAVSDLHECEPNMGVKRFKGFCGKAQGCRVAKQDLDDQPRSASRFFMESFMKTREADKAINVDRLGFNTWKKMSKEMEDETYSAMVGRVDQLYERCDEDHYDSESLGHFTSFDLPDWLVLSSSWD